MWMHKAEGSGFIGRARVTTVISKRVIGQPLRETNYYDLYCSHAPKSAYPPFILSSPSSLQCAGLG